jgi:hypothetical protein
MRQAASRPALLMIVALLVAGGVFAFHGPIAQWPSYHAFADDRTFLGVPNAQNVLSNIGFLIAGAWGALFLLSRQGKFVTGMLLAAYLVFFLGVLFTAFGSAYYHLQPDNQTLVWDRLPMTVMFMGFFAAVIGEVINPRAARALLLPLLAAGLASVLWWARTESAGAGDLRFYGLVQFLPLLLTVLMLIMYRAPKRFTPYVLAMALLYVLAKLFEHFDHEIFKALGGVAAGHALKHLVAAAAAACLLIMLYRRRN